MTEAEWLTCNVPETMRRFVWFGRPQPLRKLVLWAAACFTLVDRLGSRDRIAALETFADGRMTLDSLGAVGGWFGGAFPALMGPDHAAHHPAFVALLREVVGNPFSLDPHDVSAVTPTIASLALAAHQERLAATGRLDPARLAVLSDALEEAGCADEALLSHLRSPGPHVRGCWALDLVLGKG